MARGEAQWPRRGARVVVAAALLGASLAGCLEDLPPPIPATGGSDGGSLEGGSTCAVHPDTTTTDCSAAITAAIDADSSCFVGPAAEQCILRPSGVACDATCTASVPACRARCPSAVTARAAGADCSPPHTEALTDDPSTAACYKLRCPRTRCFDACDDRGQVVSVSRYSNLPNNVFLEVGLTPPAAGRLGVHVRYRGVLQAAATVHAGTSAARVYQVPGGSAGVTTFTDVVLFDGTPEGPYAWSDPASAPTRVTFALAGDYPFAVAEIDCVTPFYLPP